MQLEGRRVTVVGLGRSGVAAARLCRDRGAQVTLTDEVEQAVTRDAALRLALPAQLGPGALALALRDAELVVVSPGVPPHPALVAAQAAGAEVIGELELASRFLSAPMLLVGGTNGKSTVTTLCGAILAATGAKVFTGGNLGTPLCEAIGGDHELLVVEASSFQLERIVTLRPTVSVLLNITEDHLDRYSSFQAYADAKGNAFVNQRSSDVAVIPEAEPECRRQAERGGARVLAFGAEPGADYFAAGRRVEERGSGERFELAETRLYGAHNVMNAAAAIAATRALGATEAAVRQGLAAFQPLPHRMALAGVVGGVPYYDDSKGTNVGAAVTALSGVQEERAVLIAGGRDKLGDYAPLVAALRGKGRAVVLIGEAAARLEAAIAGAVPCYRAQSLEEAVERARDLARRTDCVLLSPACSSFDMFQSYAERGDRFRAAVQRLAEQQEDVSR